MCKKNATAKILLMMLLKKFYSVTCRSSCGLRVSVEPVGIAVVSRVFQVFFILFCLHFFSF